jgi:ATP-dependent Zn protease
MKKLHIFLLTALALVIVSIAVVQSGVNSVTPNSDQPYDRVRIVYADSQVDTIKFQREKNLTALSFGFKHNDSANIKNVMMYRVMMAKAQPIQAGDTLISSYTSSSNTGAVKFVTVPLTPLAEYYWFVVSWQDSLNGTTNDTATFSFNKQYK